MWVPAYLCASNFVGVKLPIMEIVLNCFIKSNFADDKQHSCIILNFWPL